MERMQKMLVCQDRECGYKETLSRTTNARCPKCHKRMEMYVKGKEETFICACGYKEKLSAFQARRAKEGAGVNKRDVQKYMRQQQKEAKEPVIMHLRQALDRIKTGITISLSCLRIRILCDGYSYLRNDVLERV